MYSQSTPLNKNPSLRLYGSKIPLGDSNQQSMSSLQSMRSSEMIFTQSLPNQSFPIFYNNTIFMVDPVALSNFSLKFKELVEPYMKDNVQHDNVLIQVLR